MQIIINMPDDMYEHIKTGIDGYSNYLHSAVRIGTPLPKEKCEDIISKTQVKERMMEYGFLALDMTVTEFVEDLPSVQPKLAECGDAISREQIINILKHGYFDSNLQSARNDPCVIDAMIDWSIRHVKDSPSVQPKPKTAHWYIDERPESDREVICSNCEKPVFKYHRLDFDYRPKYCPNCGAKMKDGD